MNHRSSTPMSKLFALMILLLLLTMVSLLVVLPLWQFNATLDAHIDQQQALLGQQQRLVAQGGELEQELEAVKRRRAGVRAFLKGATPDLAAAELQRTIKQVVQQTQGQLLSTQVLPVRDEAGHRKLSVDVKLRLHTPGLVQLLESLETGDPLLTVDRLSVRSLVVRMPQSPSSHPLNLDVVLTVTGYLADEGGAS